MDSDALSIIPDGLLAVTEGCRLPVRMKDSEDWSRAEVICMRQNKGCLMYYVHYVDNKRLDEWVSEDRLDTGKIEPAPSERVVVARRSVPLPLPGTIYVFETQSNYLDFR